MVMKTGKRWQCTNLGILRRKKPDRISQQTADTPTGRPVVARPDHARSDAPYQRIFVDHSRI